MLRLPLILFASALILLLSSCQKELDDTGGSSSVSGNFKAKIDGTWWVANKSALATRSFGFITLTGQSTDKKTLRILLADSGTHNYTVDPGSINTAIFIDSSSTNVGTFVSNLATVPGQVNITNIDTAAKTMSGTFSFKVHNQNDTTEKNFTEGSFTNIPYTNSLPIGGGGNDTLKAKISGTLWTAPTVFGLSANNQMVLTGVDIATSKQIELTFPSTITTGSYTFSFTGNTYIGVYIPDSDFTHLKVAVSGTLTILSYDIINKRIRGNFNFIASEPLNPLNTVLLTEGFFAITYN